MLQTYELIKHQIAQKVKSSGRIDEVKLIVVTKNQPVELIKELYGQGERNFGENRVLGALLKISELPTDVNWHFIGTLQSNKVSQVISRFELIHSVDSLSLAKKINQLSEMRAIETSILLQVNTSGEKSKHGWTAEEWEKGLEILNSFSALRVRGLMTMAPLTDDCKVIRSCFRRLYELRERWKEKMREPSIFYDLSMGMSNDFQIAIEEGATFLRIGSAIFG